MNELVVFESRDGVTVLRMNLPRRLNGWTMEMMEALRAALERAAGDAATKVVILTGTDPYYSAGVNLGGTLKLGHPRELHAQIVKHNQALFDGFIEFGKPILVAANGPAIGASVTSATLCDGIIASEEATFSTPFAALGVPPEGCSSVLFEKLMGAATAERILGKEGWKPTGTEAKEIGLVQWVVPHGELLAEARKIAEGWIEEGRERGYRGGTSREELLAVNARESVQVADSFLSAPFLKGQYRFLKSKKKWAPAATFFLLWRTRPLWSRLM
ncbi:MAG: enoyl-CoA hydratase/isomerase family protein [Deltaproteobacteria bacterium]|nr:enoyl-CoA hydratase/isomerase family protein [Deltaproteobacteria bacterium]